MLSRPRPAGCVAGGENAPCVAFVSAMPSRAVLAFFSPSARPAATHVPRHRPTKHADIAESFLPSNFGKQRI